MIPTKKIEELINKRLILEKDLSSGQIDKKKFAEKSKEYSNLSEIIDIAKKYISFESDKNELEKILEEQNTDNDLRKMAENELNELKLKHENNEKKLYVYDLTTSNHHFAAGIGNMIVHNTDSVFFKFNLKDAETGKKIINKEALIYTIELAKQAGELASKFLKKPHDLEYEKTFWPWALLSKKRYVGMLYETDPDKGKRKRYGYCIKKKR